jgi:peptide chain release factor subunit 1
MASAVTTDILRDLAGFEAGNGCAISIYLGFDPSEAPTTPDVETKFNSLFSSAEKQAQEHGATHDCKVALRDDLARIRAWWDDELDRDGARGVAVFASAADGFFRAVALGEAPSDSVHIGHELELAPLASLLGRGDGALAIVVSRERGTVYRLAGGRLVEVVDESDEVPGRHDQGGWSQARYQRHIEKLVKEHLKNVGEEVDRRARGAKLHIVLVCAEEMRAEFERTLSPEARGAIVGWTNAEAHAGADELLSLVRPFLDEARAREEQETLERWQEERGRGGRAAGGWKQVLDAASDARIDVLLLEEAATRQVWRCPQCGRASADGGKCPLDGTKLEEREDGVSLAIQLALLNGGALVELGTGALPDADGIAALLRF